MKTQTLFFVILAICIFIIIACAIINTCIDKNMENYTNGNYELKSINLKGTRREYYISNETSKKVLIFFHGTGGGSLVDPSFDSLISEYQIIQPIGLPNADGKKSWKSVDDVSCNSQADDMSLVKYLLDTYTDRDTKVYCAGFSVGSGFAARLSVDNISSRIDGFILCSSGLQKNMINKVTNSNCNIFIANGDDDDISPVDGGNGKIMDNNNIPCYDFSSFKDTINKWSSVVCGSNTKETVDSSDNNIYYNKRGNIVLGVIFKNTGHSHTSGSISSWINDIDGTNGNDNLFTVATRIVDGDLVFQPNNVSTEQTKNTTLPPPPPRPHTRRFNRPFNPLTTTN